MKMSGTAFSKNILLLEEALAAQDNETIATQVELLAQEGCSVRAVEIAEMYEQGTEIIDISYELAYSWYWKSAYDENDKHGFFGLARLYFSGLGVKKDMEEAIAHFKEASGRGVVEANLMLGQIYLKGTGVICNLDKAEHYLKPAAHEGYVAAYFMLSRVERYRKHYFTALKLWWRGIAQARRLTIDNPQDGRLYLLHGAWPSLQAKPSGR